MLSDVEFDQYCRRLNLLEKARKEIQHIRSSEPSRRVGGGKKNVSGRYPSKKMGQTIQFESHRNELAHIYKLEFDDDVLEYYDQPPAFFLDYLSKSGRRNYHEHTPDFFVIRTNSAGWEECKTEKDLLKKAQESPNRWQREDNGKWHCPPGEEYACAYGLYYVVRSSAEINSTFLRNFVWLEDYFREALEVDEVITCAVRSLVKAEPGIALAEIIHRVEAASVNDLNILIATNQVYVDLNTFLLPLPEQVEVFLDEGEAFIQAQITKVPPATAATSTRAVKATPGTTISWDSQPWQIVNVGDQFVGLIGTDGHFQDLPLNVFERLVRDGKIVGLEESTETILHPEVQEILLRASEQERKEALRRYRIIEPFLSGNSSIKPARTQRRWIARYLKAQKIFSRGFIGLLPKHRDKGWRREGIEEEVRLLMEQHIQEHYETIRQESIRHAYGLFKKLCQEKGYRSPSYERYRQAVRNRPLVEQIKKRQGERAAYQEEPFYWFLERIETPPHGDRPFEICHLDHTEADVELLSDIMLSLGLDPSVLKERANLGKAWVTVLIDAYSRRILAVYMSFDSPSYRSDMMVLRICVQRYGRLPQIIVVDNGADFNSTYFEVLLAYFDITKKQRPAAKPRNGTVIESFFGVADKEFWHNLMGNTQIMKNVRQVTKRVNPKNHAVWTLAKLYAYFCEYCYEIYDTCPHPALRMSPREAFEIGIARGGSRDHLFISEKEFKLLALPSPTDQEGKRKVTQQGVKINYLYYWHSSLSRIRNTKVEVKYEPFDISVAYAYVNGEWVKCRSNYLRELQGRSERELMIATAEMKKLNQLQNKQFNDITGKKLAKFFCRIEMEEAALTPSWREAKKAIQAQQKRDAELKLVHALIEGESIEPDTNGSVGVEAAIVEEVPTLTIPPELCEPEVDDDEDDDIFVPLEVW